MDKLDMVWFDRVLGRGESEMCEDGVVRLVFAHSPLPWQVAQVLGRRMVERLACVGEGVTLQQALDEDACPVAGLWTVRCRLTVAEARVVSESDARVIRGGAR